MTAQHCPGIQVKEEIGPMTTNRNDESSKPSGTRSWTTTINRVGPRVLGASVPPTLTIAILSTAWPLSLQLTLVAVVIGLSGAIWAASRSPS